MSSCLDVVSQIFSSKKATTRFFELSCPLIALIEALCVVKIPHRIELKLTLTVIPCDSINTVLKNIDCDSVNILVVPVASFMSLFSRLCILYVSEF